MDREVQSRRGAPADRATRSCLRSALLRDALGELIELYASPEGYYLDPLQQLALSTSNGISTRAEADAALEALRDSSVDFYAALRAAYYWSREEGLRGDSG
jgi:ABC-type transporter lipoprotein component MlaA